MATERGLHDPKEQETAPRAWPPLSDLKLVEALVPGPLSPNQANAPFNCVKKAVFERVLGTEFARHLSDGKDQPRPEDQFNHANSTSAKRVITDTGTVSVEVQIVATATLSRF